MKSESFRTPTERMIQKLLDCHNLQMSNDPAKPCTEETLKGSLAGLYKRGYVDTRPHYINGKQILGLYVTQKGIDFLRAKNKLD
jgi:hypothetical protein